MTISHAWKEDEGLMRRGLGFGGFDDRNPHGLGGMDWRGTNWSEWTPGRRRKDTGVVDWTGAALMSVGLKHKIEVVSE